MTNGGPKGMKEIFALLFRFCFAHASVQPIRQRNVLIISHFRMLAQELFQGPIRSLVNCCIRKCNRLWNCYKDRWQIWRSIWTRNESAMKKKKRQWQARNEEYRQAQIEERRQCQAQIQEYRRARDDQERQWQERQEQERRRWERWDERRQRRLLRLAFALQRARTRSKFRLNVRNASEFISSDFVVRRYRARRSDRRLPHGSRRGGVWSGHLGTGRWNSCQTILSLFS